MDTNPNGIVDTDIIATENHNSKYGSQLTVVEKDFATLFEGSDMKKHLTSLKRKYSGLKVKDINDTEVYEDIKKAISVVRPLRTAMEKKRKEVNKEAKTFIDSVNAMGAKIQEEIAKIEDPLWTERDKFEALQKEESERAEREAKEKLNNRVKELIENGLKFDGHSYAINNVNVSVQFIQELPDAEYDIFLGKVKVENEINIEAKAIADKAEADEKQRQEALRLQNEAKEKELKEKQDAIDAQMKAIHYNNFETEIEFEKFKTQVTEKIEKETKDKLDAETIATNAKRYEEIGWKFSYQREQWEFTVEPSRVLSISKKSMLTITDRAFEFNKQETEKIIKDKEEKDAKEAVEKLAEINRKELEAEEKRKSLLNDQQLFSEYISALSAIEPPLLTDATLVSKVNAIVKLINQ